MSGKERTPIGNSSLEKCEDEKAWVGKNLIKERRNLRKGTVKWSRLLS